jgi:sulfatase modifying factor 1
MYGNVFEWCLDYYGEDYYKESPEKDPTGPTLSKAVQQQIILLVG